MSHVADAPGSLPRPVRRDWRVPAARTLDLLTAVLATLLLSAALFGGARVYFGTVRLSAGSPWRLAALMLVVMIVRHVILRHPSTADRFTRTAAIARAAVRGRLAATITPIWIASRLGVVVIGLTAVATIGPPPGGGSVHVSPSPLVDLPFRWDTGWYLGLAVEGYRWDPAGRGQQNIAFFPGLPFLMRVGGALLGSRSGAGSEGPGRLDRLHARTLVAGWILALAASYAALVALYRWAWAMAGPRVAASSVALLSAYPFAIYFSAVYTEPFFLLSVLAAFNAVRQQRAWSAGAWGLFAGLVRPNGFLVTIPLLVLALQQRPVNKRLCAAALMPGVGMLIFSAYLMSLTGRPLVWMEAHAAWGRTPPTWQGTVTQPLEQVTNDGALRYAMATPYQILNGAALLFALGLAPFVWRRLGAAPALFVLVTVVPPLFAGGVMSMGRVTSTLFPIFVTLATLIPRRHVWAWLVLFALGQGLAAALFFSWRPMV